MIDAEKFVMRHIVADDVHYILKTTKRELAENFWGGPVPGHLLFPELGTIMGKLIRRSQIRLIVLAADPSYICSYTIAEVVKDARTTVAHFAYTREPFRRLGFIKESLKDMGHGLNFEIVATHWTTGLKYFRIRKFTFNPFVLYGVVDIAAT